MTGAAFVVGVAVLAADAPAPTDEDRGRCTARAVADRRRRSSLVAGIGVAVTGDIQGKIMTEVQPMKMAAAEALYETEQPGRLLDLHHRHPRRHRGDVRRSGSRACCRSWPPAAFDGEVEGINELREQYQETYGQDPGAAYYSPGDYTPIIPLTYWTLPADDRPRRWPPR